MLESDEKLIDSTEEKLKVRENCVETFCNDIKIELGRNDKV